VYTSTPRWRRRSEEIALPITRVYCRRGILNRSATYEYLRHVVYPRYNVISEASTESLFRGFGAIAQRGEHDHDGGKDRRESSESLSVGILERSRESEGDAAKLSLSLSLSLALFLSNGMRFDRGEVLIRGRVCARRR